MAEFSKLVITNKGQALLAKMIAGSGNIEFTQISASSTAYTTDAQLEELTSLTDVKQTSLISKITRTNEVAIEIEAAFTNTELTEGYHMKALGLYAVDPDDGEILYAVTRETSGNCYMPAYNGITVSGAYVQLITTVGNAENVSLEVNQAAVATIGDIRDLQGRMTAAEQNIEDLQNANRIVSGQIAAGYGETGAVGIIIFQCGDFNDSNDKPDTNLSGIIGTLIPYDVGGSSNTEFKIIPCRNSSNYLDWNRLIKCAALAGITLPNTPYIIYELPYRHGLKYNIITQHRDTYVFKYYANGDGDYTYFPLIKIDEFKE